MLTFMPIECDFSVRSCITFILDFFFKKKSSHLLIWHRYIPTLVSLEELGLKFVQSALE